MELSRRRLVSILSAATMVGILPLEAEEPTTLATSRVYKFEGFSDQHPNGTKGRPVLKGRLATGELIEVHETQLPAGMAPHPPHHHEKSELFIVMEGQIAFNVMGKTQSVGPGGILFAASNQEHGIRNAGTS